MTLAEINNMTTIERIQTMELLWDAPSHEPTEIDSPSWHNNVLTERQEKISSGHSTFIDIDQLKKHFSQ